MHPETPRTHPPSRPGRRREVPIRGNVGGARRRWEAREAPPEGPARVAKRVPGWSVERRGTARQRPGRAGARAPPAPARRGPTPRTRCRGPWRRCPGAGRRPRAPTRRPRAPTARARRAPLAPLWAGRVYSGARVRSCTRRRRAERHNREAARRGESVAGALRLRQRGTCGGGGPLIDEAPLVICAEGVRGRDVELHEVRQLGRGHLGRALGTGADVVGGACWRAGTRKR